MADRSYRSQAGQTDDTDETKKEELSTINGKKRSHYLNVLFVKITNTNTPVVNESHLAEDDVAN